MKILLIAILLTIIFISIFLYINIEINNARMERKQKELDEYASSKYCGYNLFKEILKLRRLETLIDGKMLK